MNALETAKLVYSQVVTHPLFVSWASGGFTSPYQETLPEIGIDIDHITLTLPTHPTDIAIAAGTAKGVNPTKCWIALTDYLGTPHGSNPLIPAGSIPTPPECLPPHLAALYQIKEFAGDNWPLLACLATATLGGIWLWQKFKPLNNEVEAAIKTGLLPQPGLATISEVEQVIDCAAQAATDAVAQLRKDKPQVGTYDLLIAAYDAATELIPTRGKTEHQTARLALQQAKELEDLLA